MADWLQKQWTGYSIWHFVLLPFSVIFLTLITVRKCLFRWGVLSSTKLPVPVIVVGNITLGGTGKTPLVIWLVEQLLTSGLKPGIISRGYGGSVSDDLEVFADSSPNRVGDEPLLLTKRTQAPVFVGANRAEVGRALLKAHPEVNVIVSDDGLQHYGLQRDVEIAVVDAQRGFGNALLLPAGPLRESIHRLNSVDAVVMTGAANVTSMQAEYLAPVFGMQLSGDVFISLLDGVTQQPAKFFTGKPLVALAGIGNPRRFFDALTKMGLVFESRGFEDHYQFSPQDLLPFKGKSILMTEKDAVKCAKFAEGNADYDIWVLPVSANIEGGLKALVLQKLTTKNLAKTIDKKIGK